MSFKKICLFHSFSSATAKVWSPLCRMLLFMFVQGEIRVKYHTRSLTADFI